MSGRGNDPIHIVHKRPIPTTGAIGAAVAPTGKINSLNPLFVIIQAE
jgi:hypothetical protein